MTQWGLDTLFNPAKRHMDDEKQRLQSTREEVGDNSGGRRVDLESGKVVIRRPDNEDAAANEDAPAKDAPAKAAPAEAAPSGDDAGTSAKTAKKPEPSAAAQRAAARRGRTAR